MALPNVSIQYKNGGLGIVPQPDDRVVGLILSGTGDGSGASVIFSPDDAYAISSITNSPPGTPAGEFLRQVEDFYKEVGSGAELWVAGIPEAMATADVFAPNGPAEKMMRQSGGRVNVIGVSRFESTPTTPTLEDGLSVDLIMALDDAQAFAQNMALEHMPVRVLLDGIHSADLPSRVINAYTYNRVGVCLASNRATSRNACMGLLLGRIAASAVNQNIGRVKSGAVLADAALTVGGTRIEAIGNSLTALNDRGYIFLRKFVNKAGYYWNDDRMATAVTDDYSSLANGRTIDKAARIAYATFVDELLDTVTVNQDTGRILATTIKQYQAKIERAIGIGMAANGEISGVEAFIDPAQDILATSKLVVDLRITPTGTNRAILVTLGLVNGAITQP